MADIKVVIQLQDTTEVDKITGLGSSAEVNNASIQKTNGSFGSLSTKSNGTNMKSWANVIKDSEGNVVSKVVNGETISQGLLSLADGYVGGANTKLIEQYGYNGYVFGAVPENKQLTVTLEVRGQYIDSIIVYGDKNANQFPTKAYRDGDTTDIIYSDDATWAIKFDNVASSHTITFLEWNRANYNACITYVAELKNKLYLDKSWLKSVESLSQSTGQPKDIYYGVVPNSGSVEIIDFDGEIKDYAKDGIIQSSNMPIGLFANENLVQSHISIDSSYNNEGKHLTIQLSDNLNKLLDVQYINKNILLSTNALILINDVFSKMGYSEEDINYILGESIVVSTYNNGDETNEKLSVKNYLSNISIPYGYFDVATFRETLNKFCTLAQLNLTQKSGNNLPKFVSSRPIVILDESRIINLPKKNQFGELNEEIFIKNKINLANYTYRQVNPVFENIGDSTKIITYTIPSDYATHRYDQSNIEARIELYKSVLNDSETNPNIVVLEESLQDVTSQQNPSLNREYYSIVKFTIDKQSFYKEFEAVDSVEFFQPLGDGRSDKFANDWLMTSNEIPIYNSDVTDNYIKNLFLAPNGIAVLGLSYSSIKLRVNENSIDVFWCFIKMITDSSSLNPIVLRCFNRHVLQLKEKKMSSTTIKPTESADINIDGNELIQTNTQYKNQKIYNINQQNIVSDYKNGISTMTISISCDNYYYTNGEIAKNWDNGEIIDLGDIVKVEGVDKLWKVTGRNFRKVGVPMIDLELQEVRVVS